MTRSGTFVEEYRGKKIMLTDEGYTAPGFLVHKLTVAKMKQEIDEAFMEDENLRQIEERQRDIMANPDSYFEADDPARYK